MRLEDMDILEGLLHTYKIEEIIKCLADLSLQQASEMCDLQLSDACKLWSEKVYVLQTTLDMLNGQDETRI